MNHTTFMPLLDHNRFPSTKSSILRYTPPSDGPLQFPSITPSSTSNIHDVDIVMSIKPDHPDLRRISLFSLITILPLSMMTLPPVMLYSKFPSITLLLSIFLPSFHHHRLRQSPQLLSRLPLILPSTYTLFRVGIDPNTHTTGPRHQLHHAHAPLLVSTTTPRLRLHHRPPHKWIRLQIVLAN